MPSPIQKNIAQNPAELIRLVVLGGCVLLIGIGIIARADFLILLLLVGVLIFAWKGQVPALGNLKRARSARMATVSANVQPQLKTLWRRSPYVQGQVEVGKIAGMNVVIQEQGRVRSRPATDEEIAALNSEVEDEIDRKHLKDKKWVPKRSFLVLYEFVVEKGRWPNKKQELILCRRQDLIIPKEWARRPLQGDITVIASGFTDCFTHKAPDTWTTDEFKDIGQKFAQSLVSMNATEDLMDEWTPVIAKAINLDETHLKEIDKIKEGGSNPAA